jgi:hypothetical protein
LAFPPDAVIGDDVLNEPPTDLLQLFGSIAEIIQQLKLRFNELPVHSAVYCQLKGYYNALLHQAMSWIQRAINKIVWG